MNDNVLATPTQANPAWVGHATRTIHQWVGEWQDNKHNLVRYTLRYVVKDTDSHDADSQDNSASASLQVSAVYIPARTAHSIMPTKSH